MTITCSYCSNFMLRSKRLQHSGQMQPFCRHLKCCIFSNRCMFYMTYRTPTIIVVIWSCLRTMMTLTLRRFFLLIALQRSADEVVGSKEPWSHHFKGPALQMEWIQVFPQFQKNPQQIYFWHHYHDKTFLNSLLQWRKTYEYDVSQW